LFDTRWVTHVGLLLLLLLFTLFTFTHVYVALLLVGWLVVWLVTLPLGFVVVRLFVGYLFTVGCYVVVVTIVGWLFSCWLLVVLLLFVVVVVTLVGYVLRLHVYLFTHVYVCSVGWLVFTFYVYVYVGYVGYGLVVVYGWLLYIYVVGWLLYVWLLLRLVVGLRCCWTDVLRCCCFGLFTFGYTLVYGSRTRLLCLHTRLHTHLLPLHTHTVVAVTRLHVYLCHPVGCTYTFYIHVYIFAVLHLTFYTGLRTHTARLPCWFGSGYTLHVTVWLGSTLGWLVGSAVVTFSPRCWLFGCCCYVGFWLFVYTRCDVRCYHTHARRYYVAFGYGSLAV